jgi:multidrug efflux pump subunit AcrB
MWIVRLALRRPYTFVVMAMAIALVGVLTILGMATDIYPVINIPVVAAIWSYTGLAPEEMEARITTQFERAVTTTVSAIEHLESQSLAGVSVVKVFLQPGSSVVSGLAQVAAASQPILRSLPPGATPPGIIQYSASDSTILQLALSSPTLPEQHIYDLATNFLRPRLATVRGAQLPLPYGGLYREVVVDLDPEKLFAWGLSPGDVSAALGRQNLIIPTGTTKIGLQEYPVLLNASPTAVAQFNDLPILVRPGPAGEAAGATTIYLKDVSHVRDGYAPQTNVVVIDGAKGALLPVLKAQDASTLDVVSQTRSTLPSVEATLPPDFHVKPLFDQSVFVRGAVSGVLREAAIAAGLTGLMMLAFLGSWRSTLIVLTSIPLALLVSIIALGALGKTLNLMTLGGMALAVGILVDDATVEIENFHRQRAMNKSVVAAILDGAAEVAVPAFVSTLCICITFVPVTLIAGAAQSLFVPLAMTVVFAMLTSYFLSRTLVPTMCRYLLAGEPAAGADGGGLIARVNQRVEHGFERLREIHGRTLEFALRRRKVSAGLFAAFVALSVALVPLLGRDFFPSVDAGQMRLHVRGQPGLRIEETQKLFAQVEDHVRRIVSPEELETVIDNIGVPVSGINLALGDPSMISAADGEMLVALKPRHRPTDDYVRALRRDLHDSFPRDTFFFLPADIATQVLNFGASAPIDVRVAGPVANRAKNVAIARALAKSFAEIPGAADVHLAQVTETPELLVDVDRTLAAQVGLTQQNVAGSLLVSLSSSSQTAPSFWLDPTTGVQYQVAVQTPQYKIDSVEALEYTPLTAGPLTLASAQSGAPIGGAPQLLANVATVSRKVGPTNITHYDIAPTVDVQLGVEGTDLDSVASTVGAIVDRTRGSLPRGTSVAVSGQAQSMIASFRGLALGMVLAVVLVYLLMAVNFQSWLDPLVILMALPGAVAGIVWMLFATGTRLSVPALMGSLMTVGVATANSILVVTFANERRHAGDDARTAAVAAAGTRMRPVLMTALAMILGMLPMSLGMGDGGEQNAPLGRAVIGGLLLATGSTLLFVPVMYSVLRRKPPMPLDRKLEQEGAS